MTNNKITVLFVFHESQSSGGATYSGINMIKSLDRTKIQPLVLVPEDGDVSQILEQMGIPCISAPVDVMLEKHESSDFLQSCVQKFKRLKYYVKSLVLDCQAVKRELSQYQIDIVHSNTTAIITGFVLAKYLRCKHVWHLREFIDKDFHLKPFFGFTVMRKLIGFSDAIIVITKAVQKHWVDSSNNKRTFQIFDAVKSSSSLHPVDMDKEKFFLFCANRVENFKGANWAMEAFCKSKTFCNGYKLVYIGNCRQEYREELLDKAKKHGAENWVEFIGYCKNTTTYFDRATAFLMCSDNEGMGRTTIEAFWNGCPVLGRNTGGTPELIYNGETGYLFDTVDELAELMQNIVKSDNTELINNARQFALANFTEEEYGKKIEKVYRTIIN